MPRTARITAAGLAYHVTHRGNRQGDVFFDREDREAYLRSLEATGRRYGLEVWAFCLMTNHIHLLVHGRDADSLARTMATIQVRHSRRINRVHGWSGHLWANRFFSHPVAGEGLWAVARYIERNPVRAGMTTSPTAYPWSSARANCGLEPRGILAPGRPLPGPIADWAAWLSGEDDALEETLRRAARTGRPVVDPVMRSRLERQLGRSLAPPVRGRPRRPDARVAGSTAGSGSR